MFHQTNTLTTGQDVLAGTAGNDTFFATNSTLQAGDSVNGGAGTDTLFYTDSSAAGVNLVATALSGIENLYVQNVAGTTTAGTKETVTLVFSAVTTAPGTGKTLTITIDGVATVVATGSAEPSAVAVASLVANKTFTNFDVVSIDGATVVLAAKTVGNITNPTVTVADSGSTAAMAAPVVTVINGTAAVTTAVTQTVDATTLTDTVQFWNNASTGAVTFDSIQQAATIGVKGVTAGADATTTANFATAMTKGTADSVSVVFDGSTDAGTVTVGTAGAGFETVNVTAIGENKVAALTTAAKTVNITGAGDLEITASLVGAKVIDGSAATGDLTIGAAATGANLTSVKTGSGDDTVTIAEANFRTASELAISLGAGDDTLVVAGALDHAGVAALKFKGDAFTISGVETLAFAGAISLEDLATLNVDGLSVDSLVFQGNVTSDDTDHSLTLSKFSGTSITFEGTVAAAATNDHVLLVAADVTGALTITTEAAATDFGLITLANATSLTINAEAGFTSDGVTAAKITSLTVDTDDTGAVGLGTVTGAALTTITATGDADFSATIAATTTKVTSIDLSGLEGAATIAAGSSAFAGTVTVKVGEGAVTYTSNTTASREVFQFVGDDIGAVTLDEFDIGAGATTDKIDFSQFAGISSADDLVFATSNETITINAAANASGPTEFAGTITIDLARTATVDDITTLTSNNIIF